MEFTWSTTSQNIRTTRSGLRTLNTLCSSTFALHTKPSLIDLNPSGLKRQHVSQHERGCRLNKTGVHNMQLSIHFGTQYQRYSWYVALFVFKAGTIPAVNALSCQTPNIPVKRPPSSPSSWWPVNCWSVAWHRQGKLIPGESSRSEAVSTKAKYTAMHLNEMRDRRVERGWVKVEGRREREKDEWKCQWFCVSERRYAQETPGKEQEGERITERNESNCVCVRACVHVCWSQEMLV